jgi:hypothetical protein
LKDLDVDEVGDDIEGCVWSPVKVTLKPQDRYIATCYDLTGRYLARTTIINKQQQQQNTKIQYLVLTESQLKAHDAGQGHFCLNRQQCRAIHEREYDDENDDLRFRDHVFVMASNKHAAASTKVVKEEEENVHLVIVNRGETEFIGEIRASLVKA